MLTNLNIPFLVSRLHLPEEEINCSEVNLEQKSSKYFHDCWNSNELCGSTFYGHQQLKTHIETVHEKVKKHDCVICGKKFGQLGHLHRHIKTILEGIKNYSCELCTSTFYSNNYLQIHIETVHEKIRKHRCDICEHLFLGNVAASKDIKTVHKKSESMINHLCETCLKKFSTKSDVRVHIGTCELCS